MTTTKSFNGFSAVIPYDKWTAFEEFLQQQENLNYYIGQREVSEAGFDHVQLLIVVKVKRALHVFIKQFKTEEHCVKTEPTENIWKYASYCMKSYSSADEQFQFGNVPPKILNQADKKETTIEKFKTMLQFDTKEEAIDYVKEEMTDKYVLQNSAIMSFLQRQYATTTAAKYTIDQFNRQPEDIHSGKSFVFIGKAGIGKTQFALAHFKSPLLVSDRQDFGKLQTGTYDGIVIDDMNFNKWNACNLIHLLDQECDRTVNIKYGCVSIPAMLPRIITLNSIDSFWPENMLDAQKGAIDRRCVIVNFDRQLFVDKFVPTEDYCVDNGKGKRQSTLSTKPPKTTRKRTKKETSKETTNEWLPCDKIIKRDNDCEDNLVVDIIE